MDCPTVLKTNIEQLNLRILKAADSGCLYKLIQRNRQHLTKAGDYLDYVERSQQDHHSVLTNPESTEYIFGMMNEEELVGVVSIIQHKPAVFGLGYWLNENSMGHGFAAQSVASVISYLFEQSADEIWAGISHGNTASINLVTRFGFELVREQPSHKSYCLKRRKQEVRL